MMVARVAPEFAITPPEAMELAIAYCELRKHYPSMIDDKTAAWFAFAFAVATIDGTRAMRVLNRRNRQKAAANVTAAAEAVQPTSRVVQWPAGPGAMPN